ncbi:transposase [Nocardia sp. NPDC049190]|uniref:IS701 family transposase n=1 Tax=Nocardia sp. NPDC049190 TaxID=3155650 RepID=UPI0033F6D002
MSIPAVPKSLQSLLGAFRPCFTTPTFTTFVTLTIGMIAAPTRRTVCGMLTAARMGGHHGRAHRFFATAAWSLDQVGLTMLGLVIGWLTPTGAPLLIAIDDTLFRRSGKKVHGAVWAYDGSRQVAKGQAKLSRGTTFVVAAVVVDLPFAGRPIALPVLFRLWRPGGRTKTILARELIGRIAAARPDRAVHVVADGAYVCSTLRHLPVNVTLTGPLPRNAALYEVHPDLDNPPNMRGRRGRPRTRGARIGTPSELAATTAGVQIMVTRYGRTAAVTVHERRCLWYGAFRSRPVRVLVVREPRRPGLALLTTDTTTAAAELIARYSARWSIEVAFFDAKHVTGAGEARNRTRLAVERTVPFGMLTQTLVILWYHLAGHSPAVVAEHRTRARWYTTKTHPSYPDMLTKLRRTLIAAQYCADLPGDPTPEQIHTIRLAWANAAA